MVPMPMPSYSYQNYDGYQALRSTGMAANQ